MKISAIKAIQILDSRGKPTVRTFVTLENGMRTSASVPSGASTGSHEAVELRDGDASKYLGMGVLTAVSHVNTTIAKEVVGMSVEDPKAVDAAMIALDGTENKKNLGANALLSVSQAVVRAGALVQKKPLWQYLNEYYFPDQKSEFPRLMVNIVNGGKHAAWNFDIQEFMIVPKIRKPSESVRIASEIFHLLGKVLKTKHMSTLVGDEGGYSPSLDSNESVLETIQHAAKQNQYETGRDYDFALDPAASEFYRDTMYHFKKTGQHMTGKELAHYYAALQQKFGIISFEDPFAEDDWDTFAYFTAMMQAKAQVVGDDLFVTNPQRIQKGITQQSANAVLIKLNQIGTVSETAEAIRMTQKAGWNVVISHRSGETEDSFIADLAYGSGADFIKTGSMSRSERLSKYNRLIEIEMGL